MSTGHHASERGYSVAAQFYDLHWARHAREAARLAAELVPRPPTRGLLDVGAGTGVALAELAGRWPTLPAYVEPSVAQRTALLTRAAATPGLAQRLTVRPRPVQDMTWEGVADLALATAVLHALDSAALRELFARVARALAPGGHLICDAPAPAGGHHDEVVEFDLGRHHVRIHQLIDRAADGSGSARFDYRWLDERGSVLYEAEESCDYAADPGRDVAASLTAAGFEIAAEGVTPAGLPLVACRHAGPAAPANAVP